ncbi:hypothetical protein DDP54_06110 [Cellulomonas sp. WB94]|nr:hypothetical protein DDP54_06110 [Cellulomonas sp. WB94]
MTALAMIPATAGVFGATVAWASAHDPLAAASSATASESALPQASPTAEAVVPQAAVDQRLLELNRQVVSAEARIAELRAALAAQAAAAGAAAASAAAVPAPVAAAPAPAPAPARAAPAPAPAAAAPAPPPPVNVVTKASK